MSHYDLYASLGLDRNSNCASISAELNNRISNLDSPYGARVEELKLARSVLGDVDRRNAYDRQLNNPSAPDITPDALRQLADHQDPLAPYRSSRVETGSSGRAEEEDRESKSWKLPIIASLVVLLMAAGSIFFFIKQSQSTTDHQSGAEMDFPQGTADSESTHNSEDEISTSRPTSPETEDEDSDTEEDRPDTLVSTPGTYGVGLQARELCGRTGSDANYVLTGEGSAQCDFAYRVGDELAGRTARQNATTNIEVYSPTQKRQLDLSCRTARDFDLMNLWKCTVDTSGSIVYVYP